MEISVSGIVAFSNISSKQGKEVIIPDVLIYQTISREPKIKLRNFSEN